MTERPEPYNLHVSESEIQSGIVKRLRAAGWIVIVTSQDRRTRRQLANIPDLICFRRGHALLVECKTPGGRLSEGQLKFRERIVPHLREYLEYRVMRYVEDADEWCDGTEATSEN